MTQELTQIMTTLGPLEFGPLTMEDLETVLDWADQEGWNPGRDDANAFFAVGRGLYGAKLLGQLVAAIAVVPHDATFAFVGLYICKKEYRGRGIGLATWKYGLSQVQAVTIGLDGVPAQEANYAKSGFRRFGATLRYQGRCCPSKRSDFVRPIQTADHDILHELDTKANGYARPRFLTSWLHSHGTHRDTRVLVDAQNVIRGFATWRVCKQDGSTKIGPIIANTAALAMELIADIAAIRESGELIIIDVPEHNADLRLLLEQGANFVVSFTTARMYRGLPPKGGNGLQAIATMELG